MWAQPYLPIAGNLPASAALAVLPIAVVLLLLGVFRKPSWMAALAGLAATVTVALFAYQMPVAQVAAAVTLGASFGIFPISWIVFWAIVLYRITVATGKFTIIQDSVAGLTQDRRLQALLVAFAFGAFIEGAAGFGAPVAVAASMLIGLGFPPFYAASICLLANTAPVAFGSIGIPIITLAGTTGLPLQELSGAVGRICAPVSLIIPSYLLAVVAGWRGFRGAWPAALVCGFLFAGTQYAVSNFHGPYLTDIASSLAAIVGLVILLKLWKPSDHFELPDTQPAAAPQRHPFGQVALAWAPYLLVVLLVGLWGSQPFKSWLEQANLLLPWPALHNLVVRQPPVTAAPAPYPALFKLDLLAASGTAMMAATLLSALLLRVSANQLAGALAGAARQLALSTLTIASVLGLAFLMNYSGATATLGLAFAATGSAFPFFSALLGWLGVFVTGSDTSANALFGNLQVVTANRLGLDPVLMAASNSSGGVMGKMISLQSIAVAAAATGMPASDEARMFRFTLRHSILLAAVLGLIVAAYASAR
jgi:lactate permease